MHNAECRMQNAECRMHDAQNNPMHDAAGAGHKEMWSRNFSSGGGANTGVIAIRRD
jgi:hypothetical protein